MGTSPDYFTHFRYGRNKALSVDSGRVFEDIFDTVIGAEVAKTLGYTVGQLVVLTHGSGDASFLEHGDKPFRVVGILEKTGTPVDRTVHISLAGNEANKVDGQSGPSVTYSLLTLPTTSRDQLCVVPVSRQCTTHRIKCM